MAFTRVSRREDSLTRGSAITGTVPWRVHGFDRVVLIRTKGVIIDVLQKVTSLESGRTVESSGTNRCRRSLFPGPGTKGGMLLEDGDGIAEDAIRTCAKGMVMIERRHRERA